MPGLQIKLAETTPRTLVCCSVHSEPLRDEGLADGRRIDPPSEAGLIHRRRQEANGPALSRRQAAARAGISPSQWSDVERGSKRAGPGIVIPVRATAETLAKMAAAVGVSAGELTAAGRDDAAGQLRSATRQQQLGERLASIPGLGILAGQLGQEAGVQAELLPLVGSGLDAVDASQLSARTRNQITGLFIANLRHDAARRHYELLLMLRLAEEATPASPREHT